MNVRKNGPCPCGSGKVAKRCCHGRPRRSMTMLTMPTTPTGPDRSVVQVSPDDVPGLLAAFEAAKDHRPGDECPICAFERELLKKRRGGAA